MKRDKFDKLFSDSVRLSCNNACQVCNKYFPPGYRQGLHCSHFFSRRHRIIRWEPMNATAQCFSCHQYLGGNPVMFDKWMREYRGDYVIDMLEEKHRLIIKLTKHDKVEMYAHMKSEFARMLRERAAGDDGILQFSGYL